MFVIRGTVRYFAQLDNAKRLGSARHRVLLFWRDLNHLRRPNPGIGKTQHSCPAVRISLEVGYCSVPVRTTTKTKAKELTALDSAWQNDEPWRRTKVIGDDDDYDVHRETCIVTWVKLSA